MKWVKLVCRTSFKAVSTHIYSKRTPCVAPGDGKQKIPMTASPGSHSCGQSFCGRHVSTLCLRVVFKEDVIVWSWHLSQEALTATITARSSFRWKVTGSNTTCEKQRSNQQCSRVAFASLWGGDISLSPSAEHVILPYFKCKSFLFQYHDSKLPKYY